MTIPSAAPPTPAAADAREQAQETHLSGILGARGEPDGVGPVMSERERLIAEGRLRPHVGAFVLRRVASSYEQLAGDPSPEPERGDAPCLRLDDLGRSEAAKARV